MEGLEHLDHYDRIIINFLANRGESTTNEVSTTLTISWATATKHLTKLEKMGYVSRAEVGNETRWAINE